MIAWGSQVFSEKQKIGAYYPASLPRAKDQAARILLSRAAQTALLRGGGRTRDGMVCARSVKNLS